MTQMNYEEIADRTIRNFIKAVVLIDDHWSEGKSVPIPEKIDSSQLNLGPQTFSPKGDVDSAIVSRDEENSLSSPIDTEPAYLQEIKQEVTNQGFLFTGIKYTDAFKETAFKVASKSDILILDWFLGAADSRPALDLLRKLKNTGSPRFIFILTDQRLENVRNEIIGDLGESTEGTDFVFTCGPFSFSLKNKTQTGGQNTVQPSNVLNEAINGIKEQYGGLLQLATLELLANYKGKLHEVLAHFNRELDTPFIAEWLEEGSPIGPNSCFRNLMIDEWRSLVEKNQSSDISILSEESISAFIVSKKDIPQWGGISAEIVKKRIEHKQKDKFPTSEDKLNELEQEIRDWMESGACNWPSLTKPRGISWKQEVARTIVWGYLSIACRNNQKELDQLATLDAFFHTQSTLPSHLGQGTILQRIQDGKYLICITPACDCERPEKRINNLYSFLIADMIELKSPIESAEGAVVAVRTKEKASFLLKVILKPSLSFRIMETSLSSNLNLSNPFDSRRSFRAKPIAQLRPTRVHSLVSLAAGEAIEVGLDRSEILRKHCKSN